MGIRDGKEKLENHYASVFVTPMVKEIISIYVWLQNHIKNVFRMKVGEALKVSDANNWKVFREIESRRRNRSVSGSGRITAGDMSGHVKNISFRTRKLLSMELIVQKVVNLSVWDYAYANKTCAKIARREKVKESGKLREELVKVEVKQSKRNPESDKCDVLCDTDRKACEGFGYPSHSVWTCREGKWKKRGARW